MGIQNDDPTAEKRHLVMIGLAVACLWVALALFPLLSLTILPRITPSQAAQLKEVLQELGTFGDMFGLLNSMFSGGALFFAVYAVLLQRRDLRHQQEQINKMEEEKIKQESDRAREAMHAATFQLHDHYQKEYISNIPKYDKEYDTAKDEEQAKETVKGRLRSIE
jgi:hypothetical protein